MAFNVRHLGPGEFPGGIAHGLGAGWCVALVIFKLPPLSVQ